MLWGAQSPKGYWDSVGSPSTGAARGWFSPPPRKQDRPLRWWANKVVLPPQGLAGGSLWQRTTAERTVKLVFLG